MWETNMIYLLGFCIGCTIWGVVVNKVIENKGYQENWFWWGFFFGFLALIVALTKQNAPAITSDTASYFDNPRTVLGKDYVFKGFGYNGQDRQTAGTWECRHCGKINASYVGTCGCGYDKSENMLVKSSNQTQQVEPQRMYCTSCGKQMEAGSKFCRFCGAKTGI